MLNLESIAAALADPAAAARALEAVADQTGDGRFRHAAGILRGRHAGRPKRDDRAALETMTSLLQQGIARSPAEAARLVARTLPDEHSVAAAADRLARQYRNRSCGRK